MKESLHCLVSKGVTIFSVLTAIGMTIGMLVEALLPGGVSATSGGGSGHSNIIIIAEYGVGPRSDEAMKSSFDTSYVTDQTLKPHYYFRNRYYGTVDFGSKYVWYVKADDWVRWINPNPRGFTKLSLEKISELFRVYLYLALSSQVDARSRIIGNDASTLNAQQIFKDNFESVVKRRVNLAEDIKRYQDVLDKVSNKVEFSVGEEIYMMPSNMNLRISNTVAGYNNKILISRKGFGVGKNKSVNNVNNLINIHKNQ